jgi:hypothetical protein
MLQESAVRRPRWTAAQDELPRERRFRDAKLATPRGEALRALLYLFARDEAIRLLGAG